MKLSLSIGGEELSVAASPEVLGSVRDRYRPFVTSASAVTSSRTPIKIEIRCRPDRFLRAYERPVECRARASSPDEIAIEGGVRGHYVIGARLGSLEDASGLGAVDAFLRVALSAALPLDGALLMHGAALHADRDEGIALCGASGSGKSTAAAALGAFCDELVVLRPAPGGPQIHSTPYWLGRPYRSRCAAIVCLARGAQPGFASLRGARAVRTLARHVVRYVSIEKLDRAVLALLCSITETVALNLASCPEGDAFIPFLRGKLRIEREVA